MSNWRRHSMDPVTEFNGDDEFSCYMTGIYEACVYFRDELGMEDAMQTDIGQEALEYFGRDS
jgi:hypothetical protein